MDGLLETLRSQELVVWLGRAGFPGATLESNGDLLMVRLAPQNRAKLLADTDLKSRLLAQAKGFGFSRVALELGGP